MSRQVHIRIDDDVYDQLNLFSETSGQTIQDWFSIAIKQLLVKAKEEPPHKRRWVCLYRFICRNWRYEAGL